MQCRELRADDKIRSADTKKMDSRVLAAVSRDLVVAEGQYHRSCYRFYTKDEATKTMSAQHHEDEPDENMANKVYSDLSQYILFKDINCSVPLTEYFIQGYQLQCTFDRVFYSRILMTYPCYTRSFVLNINCNCIT